MDALTAFQKVCQERRIPNTSYTIEWFLKNYDPSFENNSAISIATTWQAERIVAALLDDLRVDPMVGIAANMRLAVEYNSAAILKMLLKRTKHQLRSRDTEGLVTLAVNNNYIDVLETMLTCPHVSADSRTLAYVCGYEKEYADLVFNLLKNPQVDPNQGLIPAIKRNHSIIFQWLLQCPRITIDGLKSALDGTMRTHSDVMGRALCAKITELTHERELVELRTKITKLTRERDTLRNALGIINEIL